MIEQLSAQDSFPLKTFSGLLDGFQLPFGNFDPAKDWTLKYDVYSLASKNGGFAGSLSLDRTGNSLKVRLRKESPGDFLTLHDADIAFRPDRISSPEKWSLNFVQWDDGARVVPETPLHKEGVCTADGMRVATGRTVRDYPVTKPYTLNWLLFDAVQRMPREKGFSTGEFTLFDHFDQRKPEQEIRFWKTADVEFPRFGKTRLHVFEQIGRGILPIFYWLDERGCPLLVVSGIEGYMLHSIKGGAS